MAEYSGGQPTFGEAIQAGALRAVEDLDVAYPYKVISQDLSTGLVSLEPLIQVLEEDGEVYDLPPLSEVPVSYPSGGGFHLVYPLSEGDEGFVVCSSRSMSQWVESGDPQAAPEGRRLSSLTDAVFFPGLRPRNNPRPELEEGLLSIGSNEDGSGEIAIPGGSIRIGSRTASDALAKSAPVTSDLTSIATDLQTIATALNGLGAPVVITFPGPSANATLKLKAE